MSKVQNTVNDITSGILIYTPAVIAGVQAAEATNASGPDKLGAVLAGIQAGSGVLAGSTTANGDVKAISGLVNLVVSIFNALGVFKHGAK